MNNSLAVSSLAVLLMCSPAFSAQPPVDEHAGHHPDQAAAPTTAPAAPPSADGRSVPAMPGTPAMRDNMKRMQELMVKITASKNPEDRQKLLDEHSKAMREQMRMMQGMGAGQMGMMSGEMMKNHQAMMGRMEMMEMMMGQMMQHMEAARN